MISSAPPPAAEPRPRCALEPAHPFLRAGLVSTRWRKGNPYARRDWLRMSQRLAAGLSAREVARAEAVEEAAVEDLLAQEGFRALVESYRALAERPVEEQTARLVRLARIAIENALAADWDMGVAFFVLREHEAGRDPAETIAKRVVAAARKGPAAPAAPPSPVPAAPADPPRAYDPLDALVRRQTAALRRAVLAEHAAHEAAVADSRAEAAAEPAAPLPGAAATAAGARQALALKRQGASTLPRGTPHGPVVRPAEAEPPAPGCRPAAAPAPAAPARPAVLPRRPRAP